MAATASERRGVGRTAGALVALLGLTVLAAWAFDWPAIRSVVPGAVQMKANTALGLLLAGAALALLDGRPAPAMRGAALSAAALACLLGLATLGQYLFGWQLHIDELLFRDTAQAHNTIRGRMSPYTAFAFAGGGAALVALPFAPLQRGVRLLAALLILIGAVSVVGYLWNAAELVTERLLPPVAVHTAVALALLGGGIWWTSRRLHPDEALPALDRASITIKVGAALAAAFVLLVAGGGLAYRATAAMVDSAQSIAHFHDERELLARIEAALAGAEAAQRLYLLTGVAIHRDEVAGLAGEAQQALDRLQQLTAHEAREQVPVRRLRELAQARLDLLTQAIALFDARGLDAAQSHLAAGEGRELMQRLRDHLRQMAGDEAAQLQQRTAQAEQDRRSFLVQLLLTLAAMAAVFAVLVRQVRREMLARGAAEARLRGANAELEQRVASRTAELRAGEQRMRLATEATGVGLWEWDLAANSLRWDDQNFRLHGIEATPDQLVSYDDWRGVVLPEDLSQHEAMLRDSAAPQQRRTQCLRIRRRSDGQVRTLECVHTIVHADAQGRAQWVVGTTVDITEREHNAQALSQSLAMYRATLDHMLEGCQVIGFDWVYRFVNTEAARQGHKTPEALIGRSILEAFPGIESTEVFALMRRCMDERAVGHIETEFFHADGSSGWYEVAALPAPEGIVVFSFDITARKHSAEQAVRDQIELERRVAERTAELEQARKAADAANRAKSAFLAAMSHEIRTPMNGVVGMVDVLARTPLNADQADALATIRSSAFSLLGIIDDVLDFSKIEAGRLELERAALPLPELIESVCVSLQPVAAGRDVDLEMFVDPALPPQVWGDATRLRQVLTNLLGNAIKFSAGRESRRGRVAVRAQAVPGTVPRLLLRVIDNGIGMTPETIERIFSSFTQAEASTTRRYGGSGLGLAICKRLVALMNGGIAVDSRPGAGSTFSVELPLDPVAGAQAPALPELNGQACIVLGDGPRADDLVAYLVHAGVRVCRAGTLDAAAAAATGLERPVVVHTSRRTTLDEAALRNAFAQAVDARHLLVARARRGAAPASDLLIHVERNALRRAAFLRAVGVAAGRSSPEAAQDPLSPDSGLRQLDAPSVAQARERGQLILVAEDDAVNRKVILRQIAMLGHAGEVADNGLEALRLWRHGSYALLLTDLHMPEMDGYMLAEAIRREEAARGVGRHERLPIVALTANALRGEAQRAIAAGIDEQLTKPIQLHQLQATLERWMTIDADDSMRGDLQALAPGPPTVTLNVSVLESLVGTDRALIGEFLTDFSAAARVAAAEMRTAAAQGDTHRVGAIAHRLKSSSRSVGALALGDLCAELENACSAGSQDKMSFTRAQLERELTEVLNQIDRHCRRPEARA